LSESEQLKDLLGARSHMVNTSNSDHKDDSGFSRDVEGSSSSSLSLEINGLLFFSSVFLVMGLASLGVFSSLSLGLFLSLGQPSLFGVA